MGGLVCADPQTKNKGISHPFSYSFECPRQGMKKTPQVCVTYGVAPADVRSVFSCSLKFWGTYSSFSSIPNQSSKDFLEMRIMFPIRIV